MNPNRTEVVLSKQFETQQNRVHLYRIYARVSISYVMLKFMYEADFFLNLFCLRYLAKCVLGDSRARPHVVKNF
jgi:hypothetical protein